MSDQSNTNPSPQPSGASGPATVKSGVWDKESEGFVGRNVQGIRDEFQPFWTIPEDATPYVNNQPVDGNYVMKPEDNLEFVRKSGEKGIIA